MKARMFQHFAVLSCCFLLFHGCQSGPFARSLQPSDDLAQNASEKKSESDIQKKLRVAMEEERKKGRLDRRKRNGHQDDPQQLADIPILDQKINKSPVVAESRALPISSPQTAPAQVDEATVQQELSLAYDADRSGNLEKAQGYYQRVLVMDPNHFEALHRLAIIEDKKKNYPAAEAYYLKALKLDPANSNLLSDIGYSYMLQGRDDYGEKYLREALKYQPRHTRSLDHLGWYYGRTGQYDQALALFRMTSSEAEARQKFAQLFPGVNPEMNLAQSGTTQHNVQRVAPANLSSGIQPVEQVQTELQQPVQYATAQNGIMQYQGQPTVPAMNQAGLNPTQQIAEMMRREREKAVQTRDAGQELPAISPQQSMMPQTASAPQNPLPYQDNRQHLVHAPQPVPVQYADPDVQIQAWPPAGDPEISQAVDASNYWAMKEQQQNQPVPQTPQNQYPNQQYPNQQYQSQTGQEFPQAQQGQYQNMPYGINMPGQQQMPVNMPQAGQPMYGNQYQVPGQFPDYRINSTQQNLNTENQYSENQQQNTDQAQMREAARTGMNAGPGQMFPVAEVQQNADANATLRSPQMQVGTLIPASAQVPQQNVFQPGGQNIRQVQFDQSVYQQQQPQAGGVRQAGYEYSNQPVSQNGYQGQGIQPVQNAGGFPQFPSELPQSAMYSTNPAFAPANMRTTTGDLQQGVYQASQQTADQNRQLLMNPNQSAPSRFQWGAQPVPVPGQYSNTQSRY